MPEFQYLFSPVKVGPMNVPNRIVETTNSAGAGRADGLPDAPFIEHHGRKARGGTGWIGSESWTVSGVLRLPQDYQDPPILVPPASIFAHPNFVERVRVFTDAVHACGAVSIMQLSETGGGVYAPSPVRSWLAYDFVPHELEEDEIESLIEGYAMAAEKFLQAGADGIEIHCAHEMLPQWFLSPYTNRRLDRWGGSVENRTRFVTEILQRVRQRIGTGMALGIRVCADEYRDGGYHLEDMQEMLGMILAKAQLDFLNVDVGTGWGFPSYIGPMQYPLATFADTAAAIRSVVSPIPVIYAGRVNDPVLAERLLTEGKCDLVAMTRAGIADPEFPRKIREGRMDEIRKCVGVNRCIEEFAQPSPYQPFRRAACATNPEAGKELEWQALYRPATQRKRVVVVGGGPAGLEAARVAASRGHKVTLLEQRPELGGQLLIAAKAPQREGFLDFPRWQTRQMELLGVDVRLDRPATVDGVLALNPEVVFCATGSVPMLPDALGIDQPNVAQAWDVLEGMVEVGARVAVLSQEDHMETISVADFLATRGKQVEIFHKWLYIGSGVERYTRGIVFHRLSKGGVIIHPSRLARRIDGNTVVVVDVHTGAEHPHRGFDTFVLSCGSRPEVSLYRALKGKVPELQLIGAAMLPRDLYAATQSGATAGRDI